MRHATASQLKGYRRAPVQGMPREGTKIREVYDLFQSNKGRVIPFVNEPGGNIIVRLNDFYGLDIRRYRNGHWVLAGEWFGKVYVDYIAQRVAA